MIRLMFSYLSEHEKIRDGLLATSWFTNLLISINWIFSWVNFDATLDIAQKILVLISTLLVIAVSVVTLISKIQDMLYKKYERQRENRQDEEKHREEMKEIRDKDSARTPRT